MQMGNRLHQDFIALNRIEERIGEAFQQTPSRSPPNFGPSVREKLNFLDRILHFLEKPKPQACISWS